MSCRNASWMRQNADVMHGKPTSHKTDPRTFGITCQAENISVAVLFNILIELPKLPGLHINDAQFCKAVA